MDINALYSAQRERMGYRLSKAELLQLAEAMRVMQSMLNLQSSNLSRSDNAWGALDEAMRHVLNEVYGDGQAVRILSAVYDNGESIAYQVMRFRDLVDWDEALKANHLDYPHHPGMLYGCPACDNYCQCEHINEPGETECIHCAKS